MVVSLEKLSYNTIDSPSMVRDHCKGVELIWGGDIHLAHSLVKLVNIVPNYVESRYFKDGGTENEVRIRLV